MTFEEILGQAIARLCFGKTPGTLPSQKHFPATAPVPLCRPHQGTQPFLFGRFLL